MFIKNKFVGISLIVGLSVFLFMQAFQNSDDVPLVSPEEAIQSFDPSEVEASVAKLDQYILFPKKYEEAARAAGEFLQDGNLSIRFAAVYVLALTGDESDQSHLIPVLNDQDQALRSMAAGRLIGWGAKASIPVLIDSLHSKKNIPFSHPPKPLWTLAQESLPHYTNQDFGLKDALTAEEVRTVISVWESWWNQNKNNLRWDKTKERYVL